MDYVFWAALGASGTAITCAGALLVHIVRYAYSQGETNNRLAQLERSSGSNTEFHGVLSSLQATVSALQTSVERLDRALERMDEKVSRTSRTSVQGKAA